MEIGREKIEKIEKSEDFIRNIKIEEFRKLTKEEIEKLLTEIKSRDEISHLENLANWANLTGDNVECQEQGHDFSDWQPVEYDSWQMWYTKDFWPEIGTDDGMLYNHRVEDARICQRCAKVELRDRVKQH